MPENVTNPDFGQFVYWAFLAVLTGGVSYSAIFLSRISKNIAMLNTSIAMIIERTQWHQKELEMHDKRISSLEVKRQSR